MLKETFTDLLLTEVQIIGMFCITIILSGTKYCITISIYNFFSLSSYNDDDNQNITYFVLNIDQTTVEYRQSLFG